MSGERVVPLAQNERVQMLLGRLRQGPASTVDLQATLPLVHVARQVWELRHWYGFQVKTRRLANNVALYTLGAGSPPERRPLCPTCGTELTIVARGLDDAFATGVCSWHGRQMVKV